VTTVYFVASTPLSGEVMKQTLRPLVTLIMAVAGVLQQISGLSRGRNGSVVSALSLGSF